MQSQNPAGMIRGRGFWLLLALLSATACLATVAYRWWKSAPTEMRRVVATGDVSLAMQRIVHSHASGSASLEDLLLAATCARRLADAHAFEVWLKRAQEAGADEHAIQAQKSLMDVLLGGPAPEDAEGSIDQFLHAMAELGVPPDDALYCRSMGYIRGGNLDLAQSVLEYWERHSSESTQLQLAMGIYWSSSGEVDRAVQALWRSIELSSRNELAFLALSEIYAQPPNGDFAGSRRILEYFVEHFPENEEGRLRLSSVLRQMGEPDAALHLFDGRKLTIAENMELSEVAFDLGYYDQALDQLAAAGLESTGDFRQRIDQVFESTIAGQGALGVPLMKRNAMAATAMAMAERRSDSRLLFQQALNRVARIRRYIDLVSKQPIFPDDRGLSAAVDEILDLSSSPRKIEVPSPAQDTTRLKGLAGYALYIDLCGHCHGEFGDGLGIAARHLFPPPRNLVTQPMRYVSGEGGLATDQDLQRTIRSGLGGVSMPAYPNLDDAQLTQLIEVIREFQQVGLEATWQALADADVDLDVPKERWVLERLKPASEIVVPEFAEPTPMQLLHGKRLFQDVGCVSCHPADAQAMPDLFTIDGKDIDSRDLVRDPFRGGSTLPDIFKRITLGIPGTPHPALKSDSVEDIIALVHFVGSEYRGDVEWTNFDRRTHQFRRTTQ